MPARAALLAIALAAATAGPSAAASWSETFATVSDTMVFLGTDGTMWRGPFHLGARETLWTPREGERVADFAVNPAGGRVAWLTRSGDDDTTRLWTGPPSRSRVRFHSLQPRNIGRLHFEPVTPSRDGRDVRGVRLLASGPQQFRYSTNALVWTPDGGAVAFGYDDGLALLPADSGAAVEIGKALVIRLIALDPANVYLADVVYSAGGVRRDGWHLLYPAPTVWRLFASAGLDDQSAWVADAATVWWADGRTIRRVEAHDPTPHAVHVAAEDVTWLGRDAAGGQLHWSAGRELFRMRPDQRPERVLAFAEPIAAVRPVGRGALRAVVAGDSLAIWNPAGDRVVRVRHGGASELFLEREGTVLMAGGKSTRTRLAALDLARGAITALEVPVERGGVFAVVPDDRLILFKPGNRPPERLHVFDPATRRWVQIPNPGITAWEPMAPR